MSITVSVKLVLVSISSFLCLHYADSLGEYLYSLSKPYFIGQTPILVERMPKTNFYVMYVNYSLNNQVCILYRLCKDEESKKDLFSEIVITYENDSH